MSLFLLMCLDMEKYLRLDVDLRHDDLGPDSGMDKLDTELRLC